MSTRFGLAILFQCCILVSSLTAAEPVVTNVYENLDTESGFLDRPVTFSRIGAEGDFTDGITPFVGGRELPAQVDVLRRAPDGSIRHALVSFVLPILRPSGTVRIDWLNQAPAAPPDFQWGPNPTLIDLKLTITPEAGSALTSDLSTLLNRGLADPIVKVLHDGPVMKEYEIHDVPKDDQGTPDPLLDVYWRLRFFSGESSFRVCAIVENCEMWYDGMPFQPFINYSGVEVAHNGQPIFTEVPFKQYDMSRYRILCWTGDPLENIHRRPNYDYWVKGRFVPLYNKRHPFTRADVDDKFTSPNWQYNPEEDDRIMGSGIIYKHMPATGGRSDIGPYPAWTVCYLLTGAQGTYEKILHADGNGGGCFWIHIREDVDTPGYRVENYVKPPRYDSRLMPYSEDIKVRPDGAHTPSIGYISYLLTGDKYYAEEMSFWASYHLGFWPHEGLIHTYTERHQAWCLRLVVDAAFILPETHPLQDYFHQSLLTNFQNYNTRFVQSSRRVHYIKDTDLKSSGRTNWVNSRRCSTWQYAWIVWALHNAVTKGYDTAIPMRDWAAEYIIGFYTSDDVYVAPDGKRYRYDPMDANAYSTATALVNVEFYDDNGSPALRSTTKIKDLDNYGEIWYYTKMNEDNTWTSPPGLTSSPDGDGHWPLEDPGWGHGQGHYSWHRYGAWCGIVGAYEGGVANSEEAYNLMYSLASQYEQGDPGRDPCLYEMAPRLGEEAAAVELYSRYR